MNRLAVVLLAIVALSTAFLLAAPPPAKPKPQNLPVNTRADEDDPFEASNGLTLYYAANAKGKWDLMIAERKSALQNWRPGVVLQDYIQTEGDDRGCCVTAERRYPQYLYYATTREKGGKNYDLYVGVKQGAGKAFAEPTPVQAVDTEADEKDPWLTADGRHLYFSRKTPEGWRVFVASRKQTTGAQGFGEPVLIKELPPGFQHATLTPDGYKMYLQGPLGKNRWGLFLSTKTAKGWSEPQPLELNDPAGPTGDRSPSLSRNGLFLYFASDRPGGKGGLDLYVVPTTQAKPKDRGA